MPTTSAFDMNPHKDFTAIKEWSLGAKIIAVSFLVAIVSMFLGWVGNGIGSANGWQQGTWLFMIIYLYPLERLIRRQEVDQLAGVACGTIGVLFAGAFILTKTCSICGQTFFTAEAGPFVFLATSLLLSLGILKYEPIESNRSSVAEPAAEPYALPGLDDIWNELEPNVQTLVIRVLYGLVAVTAVLWFYLTSYTGGLNSLQVVSRFDHLLRKTGQTSTEMGMDETGRWFAVQGSLDNAAIIKNIGIPDEVQSLEQVIEEWTYNCPDGKVKLVVENHASLARQRMQQIASTIQIKSPGIKVY